jgi:hypothetical protein
MLEAVSQSPAAISRANALARWDNEGGALPHPVPVRPPIVDVAQHLFDQKLVCVLTS